MNSAQTDIISMAYLVKEEMKSVIRQYELDTITDGDDEIVDEAIARAVEKAADMITPNDKKKWYDGRVLYDAVAEFGRVGDARNLRMIGFVKSIALYYVCELTNVGSDYKDVQGRYDRAEQDLRDLADGTTTSSTLPRLETKPADDDIPFAMGSRRKFNHDN